MERFENLLDFVNELNETGRIQYDDYSRLFDLVQEFAGAEEAINAAATDIAALLWLNGNCEYCEHGEKEERAWRERGIQRREQMALPPREWHRLPPCVARGCNEGFSAGDAQSRADFASCKAQPRGDYVRAERDLGYP